MRDRLRVSMSAPHLDQRSFHADRHQIANPGRARVDTGAFFQEASRLLFNGVPHSTDSTADYCPDLSLPDRVFVEVKSIGDSRQAIIFSKRLAKDRKFRRDENVLFYAFWIHRARVSNHKWREDLYAELAASVECLLIVPAARINGFLRGKQPTGILLHKGGKVRDTFHRIALGDLMRLTATESSKGCHGHAIDIPGPSPFGIPMPTITTYGSALQHVIQLTAAETAAADEMLYELSSGKLEVRLAPAPRPQYSGHKVRVVENCNPTWYRDLAALSQKRRKAPRRGRKSDTDQRRDLTLTALARLAAGRCDTCNCWRLRMLVRARAGLPAIGR